MRFAAAASSSCYTAGQPALEATYQHTFNSLYKMSFAILAWYQIGCKRVNRHKNDDPYRQEHTHPPNSQGYCYCCIRWNYNRRIVINCFCCCCWYIRYWDFPRALCCCTKFNIRQDRVQGPILLKSFPFSKLLVANTWANAERESEHCCFILIALSDFVIFEYRHRRSSANKSMHLYSRLVNPPTMNGLHVPTGMNCSKGIRHFISYERRRKRRWEVTFRYRVKDMTVVKRARGRLLRKR